MLTCIHNKTIFQELHDRRPPTMMLLAAPMLEEDAAAVKAAAKLFASPIFRSQSLFIRVADLGMDETSDSATSEEHEAFPNYHHAAADPPPGIDHDPKERWIALTDAYGIRTPIAPNAVQRLANFGWETCFDPTMWTPHAKTGKVLKNPNTPAWVKYTFLKCGKIRLSARPTSEEQDVFVWTGNFKHGLYGSELPAVRSCGIVNMSAKALMDLLVDSCRVKEYNKLSLGRQDLVTFQDNMDSEGPFGRSITKVMKSESKPPMIRKSLIFVSVMHAKELEDGSGYLIVSRAVHTPEERGDKKNSKSENLIGVNLIRKVEGAEDSRCFMTNVNHLRSPMVPMMVAKRLGLTAAVGFMNDIRSRCR
jgi:hypothetical protein